MLRVVAFSGIFAMIERIGGNRARPAVATRTCDFVVMQIKWIWIEREFEFGFPPEKISDILERLRGTPLRVRHLVDDLNEQTLRYREGDTWSIQENVGHLGDVESLWIGRVADIIDGLKTMREADPANTATCEAGHHDSPLDAILGRFCQLREQLVRIVEILPADHYSRAARHPRLGCPMRIVDLCHFVAEHDDYHLARIRYLKKQLRVPRSG